MVKGQIRGRKYMENGAVWTIDKVFNDGWEQVDADI